MSRLALIFAISASWLWAAEDPLWEQARAAYARGEHNVGNQALAALIAQNPGDTQLAERCLLRLRSAGGNSAGRLDPEWEQYVREGLVALERLGVTSAESAVVRKSIVSGLDTRIRDARLFEAIEELDRLAAENPGDLHWQIAHAKGYWEVDSSRASALFETLKRQVSPESLGEDAWRNWESLLERVERDARDLPPVVHAGDPTQPLAEIEVDDREGLWQNLLAAPQRQSLEELDRLFAQAMLPDLRVLWRDQHAAIHPAQAMDLQLCRKAPADLQRLRSSQNSLLTPRQAAKANTASTILEQARRYPWASVAQRRLLLVANRALWTGQAHAALRSYRELLRHSVDAQLRSAAQVGLWAAAVELVDAAEFAALFDGMDDTQQFPWMGETASVAAIRERLSVGREAPRPPIPGALASLNTRIIQLPALGPWPSRGAWGGLAIDFQDLGTQILLSSRNLLALYEVADLREPVWQQLRRPHRDDDRHAGLQPGYFRPLVSGETIFARYGVTAMPRQIAAIDRERGGVNWSTAEFADRAHHDDMRAPICDPVLLDGRLVYLQWNSWHHAQNGRQTSLSLVSYDPVARELAWDAEFVRNTHASDITGRFKKASLRSAAFGNPVVAKDGAIYCSTNSGVVVRCDARDGRMDWMHCYRRGPNLRAHPGLGATPVIHENRVIFLPRDTARIFALDRETGRLLWDNPLPLPVECVGLIDGTLVVRGLRDLIGFDPASGKVRWSRPLLTELIGRVQGIGSTLYMADERNLYQVDGRNGRTLASRPWNLNTQRPMSFLVKGDEVFVVTDLPRGQNESAIPSAPTEAAFAERWTLHRPNASITVAALNSALAGHAYVLADSMLECVDAAKGKILWRRFCGLRKPTFRVIDNMLLGMERADGREIGHTDSVSAYDGLSGELLWRFELAGAYSESLRQGDLLLLHDSRNRLMMIDLAAGRKLWERQLTSSSQMRPRWDGESLQVFQVGHTRFPERLPLNARTGQESAAAQEIVLVGQERAQDAVELEDGYYQVRFAPVKARHVRLVSLTDVSNRGWASGAEVEVELADGSLADRAPWRGMADNYEKARDCVVERLWDGDRASWWHTEWLDTLPGHPHWISIDLGSPQTVAGFRYLPARIVNQNGTFSKYEFYTSENGKDWGKAKATGVMVQKVHVRRLAEIGDHIFIEAETSATRKRELYRYEWGAAEAQFVLSDVELAQSVGDYLLLRRKDDKNAPLLAISATDPAYRFSLAGMPKRGESFVDADRLVTCNKAMAIADLKAKTVTVLPPPEGMEAKKGNAYLRYGEDQLLAFIHQGNKGQMVHVFDLRGGETQGIHLPQQRQAFERTYDRNKVQTQRFFDDVILLYDKSLISAWTYR